MVRSQYIQEPRKSRSRQGLYQVTELLLVRHRNCYCLGIGCFGNGSRFKQAYKVR